jgi:hypothetical protein
MKTGTEDAGRRTIEVVLAELLEAFDELATLLRERPES